MPDRVIIETDFEVRWRQPVWVKIGYGMPEAVKSPQQALNHLNFRWPALRGPRFQEASSRCRSALRKEVECEVAREAFARAAEEADVVA